VATGCHGGLRDLTRRHGTLLAIDETHTLVTAYGRLTTTWGLEPDLLTVGKPIASGVPLGAYGMTDDVAAVLGGAAVSGIAYDEVAAGGTLFANALSMAAARAALTEVLTQEAFHATARLGEVLAAGLREHTRRAGLPWSVNVHGWHAYYFFSPQPPRDAGGRAGRRQSRPARADPPLPRRPRRMGIRLVAWTDGLGCPYSAGRAVVPRRDRRIHPSRDMNEPDRHVAASPRRSMAGDDRSPPEAPAADSR
jgi:hypothetical protein